MKKSLKKKLDFIIRRPFHIIKNTVFFQSFGGQYNDNPKYISIALHEMRPDINIVWAVSESKAKLTDIPEYVYQVNVDSKEYVRYSCKSQVLIDNMMGIRGFVSETSKKLLPFLIRSKSQLNISTWHGIPYKKVGLDEPALSSKKYMYTSAEYISAGSSHSLKYFKQAFYPMPIKMNGSPRNDILVNVNTINQEILRRKLGLPQDRKIALFAPTFRDSVEESGIRQMRELDVDYLLELLHKKFGGEWCFVFRVHHTVLEKIDASSFGRNIISGNEHDDMAEYLAIADVLITDYSGSCLDYTLTHRPCFLLTMDRNHYINDERGLYMSIDQLPFKYADTVDDFYELIKQFDCNSYESKINSFLEWIGNREDGHSAEKIVKDIIQFIDSQKK